MGLLLLDASEEPVVVDATPLSLTMALSAAAVAVAVGPLGFALGAVAATVETGALNPIVLNVSPLVLGFGAVAPVVVAGALGAPRVLTKRVF